MLKVSELINMKSNKDCTIENNKNNKNIKNNKRTKSSKKDIVVVKSPGKVRIVNLSNSKRICGCGCEILDMVNTISIKDLAIVLVVFFNMLNSCRALPRPDGKLEELTSRKEAYRIESEKSPLENLLNDLDGRIADDVQQRIVRIPRKAPKFLKEKHRRWNLDPIKIQINNVIGKYSVLNPKFDELYNHVKGCGINSCQRFNDFIPNANEEASKITKSKKLHHGKRVNDLLAKFHEGLQKIEKSLETVIPFEESHSIGDENRKNVLRELKGSIKSLTVEVEEILEYRNVEVKKVGDEAPRVFLQPSNVTDLTIQEWYIIQSSKLFVIEWKDIIDSLKKGDLIERLRNRT